MDALDSHRNLSKVDILFELCSQRYPVLNDRELEAGYAACQKFMEITKAPTSQVLRLRFYCATRLGYKDGGKMSNNRFMPLLLEENTSLLEEEDPSLLEEEYSQNTSTQPKKKDKKKKKKKKKKKPFESTPQQDHQQDPASSNHRKESEKERRTFDDWGSFCSEGSDHGYESWPVPTQIGIGYEPLPTGFADDIEVEKEERSVFLCISNLIQGRYGCDWYRLDLVKKKCNKIFGRLEWGGIEIFKFGVATIGSTIYILGGLYPNFITQPYQSCCNDVFYLDVLHPRDGWKAGPQLPSPHYYAVATAMNETVYIFNGKYVFARGLDTSDPQSGWKSLAECPNLELPLDLQFTFAFPDPIRDRILLYSFFSGFFAYYADKGELGWIQSELEIDVKQFSGAAAVVDGVFYYHEDESDVLLCAFDLDQRKILTPYYSFEVDIPYDTYDQLLDLGGGKLCLVNFKWGEESHFVKLKVEKEAGGDKVHITVVSFDMLRIVEGSRFVHFVAL